MEDRQQKRGVGQAYHRRELRMPRSGSLPNRFRVLSSPCTHQAELPSAYLSEGLSAHLPEAIVSVWSNQRRVLSHHHSPPTTFATELGSTYMFNALSRGA